MNKLKKSILGLPLLVFLLPGCSFHVETGKDEQGLEFHLKDNKEYYVSGGTSTDLSNIVVPETFDGLPVTGIEWPGFQGQQMESITLPGTIKHLDNAVFYNCASLKSIVIPEGVTTISNSAFGKCTSLASVLIPNSVNYIELGAFDDCTSLECNEYDNGKYLGNPDNPYLALVKAKGKTIETCKINDKCELIASEAFSAASSLSSIEIPGNIDSIGEYAFWCCTSLGKVDIHDGVTFIGDSAFSGCKSLTTISMPDSIACIEAGAFDYSTSLECNEYDNAKYLGNPNNPHAVLFRAKDEAIETCRINDNCKLILNHAFYVCGSLTEVEMPNGIKFIGEFAFGFCQNLSAIRFKGTAAEWDAIEKDEYWNFHCPASVVFNYGGASA